MMVAFPESEYRQRLARAREALREGGLKGYLAVAPEHLYYLAGYDGHTYWSDQGCVFTVDGDEPTLVIRDTDEGVARETAWVQDVRTYRYGLDDSLALIGRQGEGAHRQAAGRGPLQLRAAGGQGARLLELLGPIVVEDATERIGFLRARKSPAELAYVRQAAKYAHAGMGAARSRSPRTSSTPCGPGGATPQRCRPG